MLKIIIMCVCTAMFTTGVIIPCASAEQDEDFSNLKMSFSTAGVGAYQGLPIGNGRIGARIHGGVEEDLYRLNDATFWGGGPQENAVYDATGNRKKALEKTRELLSGDLHDWSNIQEIESAAKGMSSNSSIGSYLPLGDMVLKFDNTEGYTGYSRELNFNKATAEINYRIGNTQYKRESFASFPDNVMVTRLTASTGGRINVNTSLKYRDEMEGHDASVTTNGTDEVIMRVRAPYLSQAGSTESIWVDGEGMIGEAHVKVINNGGVMTADDNSVSVSGADEVILIYSSATSYNGPNKNPYTDGKNPTPIIEECINAAAEKTYDELYNAHIKDYQGIFHNLYLEINGQTNNANVLAFQAKRYDLIATSRYGDRPRSAFGMWNEDFNPTSEGSHYLNENVQKMYGHIEAANVSDVGEPLWNWMDELAENGSITAEKDYGFNGWVTGHNSDIWCTTSLRSGRTEWSIFPVGGIWLCNTIWEHYLFSNDEDFLRNRAYPLMKGAAEFASDLLVEREFTEDEVTCAPGTYLVTSPSTSCENSYGLNYGQDFIDGLWQAVSVGSTQDMTMIRGLFQSCIKAAEILGIDSEFAAELQRKYDKLLPYQVHKTGEIQEWAFEDYMSNWNRDLYKYHRHASHLIGVWPYNQITKDTPELYTAAKTALDTRGGGTASRMPDKAAMLARLGYGDDALSILPTGTSVLVGDKWCDNLQNAVCEMILQSHTDYLDILPALPSAWKSGKIKGICARGGYELDIEWDNSELTNCVIKGINTGEKPQVKYKGSVIDLETNSLFTFVDMSEEQEEASAENITAQITNTERNDNVLRAEYSIKSNQENTATNTAVIAALYNKQGILKKTEIKNVKIYNTQNALGNISINCGELVGDGNTYDLKVMVWLKNNMQPLTEVSAMKDITFKVKQVYNSIEGFSSVQGEKNWRYQYTSDFEAFTDLPSFISDGEYWGGTRTWLRVGALFMHPDTESSVRTFVVPVDGKVKINKSTVKAENDKGGADGVRVKIVKTNSVNFEVTQIYPVDLSQEWLDVDNAAHKAGAVIPDVTVDVNKGDMIHFILNQGGTNGRDGTYWTTSVEYIE